MTAIIHFKSQNDQGNYSFQLVSSIKAPQTSDFIRYGNIPINKFVGEPNLEIPLINLKSNQLGDNLSVSLGYNFSGFIPNKRPDIVGLNWFLNAGGVITRQVNSTPDDQKGQSATNGALKGLNKDGLIVGLRSKSNCLPFHDNVGIFNLNQSVGAFEMDLDYKLYGCDFYTAYEGDADIFSFNFNGYSGKFFLGNDNQIKIISEDSKGFKIDISNVATQPLLNICKPLSSEIKITDNRGNEYYFGGASKNLEYNVSLAHGAEETVGGIPVINSWYLRQIKYSNGENIYFNYLDDSLLSAGFCNGTPGTNIDWHGLITSPKIQERRKFIIYNKSYSQDLACTSNPGASGNMSYIQCNGGQYSYSLTKKAILDNISTSNYNINFKYSLQPYIFNYEPNDVSYFQQIKNIKLDSLSLHTASGKLINKFDLSYELIGGTANQGSYPRLFLKSVQENGKPPYLLNYNLPYGNFPKATTKQIDHWGFYNGKSSNESLAHPVPSEATDQSGDYYFTSDVRDADFNFSSKGVLNEIIYPTKGSTSFEYEAPEYNNRIERKKATGYLPSLYSYTGTAGGIRIKRIIDRTDGIIAKEREYQYENGVLMQWPRYSMLLFNGYQSYVYLRSSSINMNILESSVINYGKVVEINSNNGSIVSEYSNYLTVPDINDFNTAINNSNPLSLSSDLALAKNYIGLFLNDMSLERGKLLHESIYDNAGKILHSSSYTYNRDPQKFNDYSTILHLSGPAVQTNKRYYYPNNITQKETSEYFSENGQTREIKTIENYTYSGAPDYQQTGKQTIFTNGSVEETSTKFAYQDVNSLMISKNMISIPIENTIVKKININDGGKVVSRNKIIYPTSVPTTQTGNLVLPTSIKSYDILNLSNTPFSEFTYDQYDAKGNLQQYTTKEGVPVSIIWGYNSTQPIAKIEGATYAQVSSLISVIITASDTDGQLGTEASEQALITELNLFRNNTALSAYQTSTYTYDPLIGVKSITPPSGIREVYLYDIANRLKEIKQEMKNTNGSLEYKILKEFNYNYKN